MREKKPEFFINLGVLTGSRAFGVENNNSDYDIAITTDTFQEVMPHIKKSTILSGENSANRPQNRLKNRFSVKFLLDSGDKINLIAFDTSEAVEVIKQINEEMNSFSITILGPKEERHAAFEDLINKHMTNQVLGIPEINIDEDEIPFDLNSYCDIDSF